MWNEKEAGEGASERSVRGWAQIIPLKRIILIWGHGPGSVAAHSSICPTNALTFHFIYFFTIFPEAATVRLLSASLIRLFLSVGFHTQTGSCAEAIFYAPLHYWEESD